jgi:hypothetical protein
LGFSIKILIYNGKFQNSDRLVDGTILPTGQFFPARRAEQALIA